MINSLLWLIANRDTILSQAEAARKLALELDPEIQRLRPIVGEIADALESLAAIIRQRRAGLPERERAALHTLAGNGWYVDGGLSPRDVAEVADAFERGDWEAAAAELCSHLASREAEIEDDLSERFSTRTEILADAFTAHRTEEYTLSVPVFLIQAIPGFDLLRRLLPAVRGGPPAQHHPAFSQQRLGKIDLGQWLGGGSEFENKGP